VFTLLNAFIFRVDEVRSPHELFAVERQRSPNAEAEGFTRPQYEALVRETGVFSGAFARTPDIDRWIDGQRMEGPLVTGNANVVLEPRQGTVGLAADVMLLFTPLFLHSVSS
jgi:hypothetical protein